MSPLAVAAFALTLAAAGALAAEPRARLSLLPGWMGQDGVRRAGLAIDLAPGWKTYWRSPGEAGLPPRLDWSGSENVAAVEVVWPRPETFETSGLQSFGYADGVVLPLLVTPRDATRPISLRLGVELGVCDELCVLESAEAALEAGPEAARDRSAVAAALAAAPEDARAAGAEVLSCGLAGAGGRRLFSARVALAEPFAELPAVALEGPEGVWFGRAAVSREGDALSVSAEASVRPAERWVARDALRLTLIGEERAVEIDGCGAGGKPRG